MKILTIVNCFLILFTTSSAQKSDPFARDLVQIVQWFEGEFDNDSQIWFESRSDWRGTETEKHERQHIVHTKINAPQIGEYVFYVKKYMNDNPEAITQQQLVSFKTKQDVAGIVMEQYQLNEANVIQIENIITDDVIQLNIDDINILDGCEVIFNRQGDQFHGEIKDKTCQFSSGDELTYTELIAILSESKYWYLDRLKLLSTGEIFQGQTHDIPFKMRKATMYSCDVSYYEKGYYGGSEKDKKYENVIIHNQGGKEWFYNPINQKTYGLQLREKEYPFYSEGADFFMMRFIEKGQNRSEVIVTSEPYVDKLSFSLGWASGVCYKQ